MTTTKSLASFVEELVSSIENGTAGPMFSRDIVTLEPAILRSLAEGKPASIHELAAAVGRSPEAIVKLIERTPEIDVDRDNRVLGTGVTLLPTPHRIQLPGRNHLLYGYCVPDTLFAARILGEPLRVTSSCPATGEPVVLEVEPNRIRAADPPTAVMSLVTWFDPDDLRATGCGHMNLFVSADAAADFQAGYPHVVNVPVPEVFDVMAPVFDVVDRVRGARLDERPSDRSAAAAPSCGPRRAC